MKNTYQKYDKDGYRSNNQGNSYHYQWYIKTLYQMKRRFF